MWNHIPFDLLSTIFSFLPPDSLARVSSVCRHWQTCATSSNFIPPNPTSNPPWFLAFPTRTRPGLPFFAHNPATSKWHKLNLDSLTVLLLSHPARPISTTSGLILLRRLTSTTTLHLSVLNPFTRKFIHLPQLLIPRTNAAVGLVDLADHQNPIPRFKIYVAGGMLDGSKYEPTMEMYDSWTNRWEPIGKIPVEYAVRLTVWTPNESAWAKGVVYWMTSARAYSVMGIEIGTNRWMEQSVPMAERLEFAALVIRRGRLTVVGGESCTGVCAWELCDGDDDGGGGGGWKVTGKVPSELGMRLVGKEGNWVGVKCVGIEGAVWLYKGEVNYGGGMVVWSEVDGGGGRWEWSWVDGCGSVQGSNFPIKGLLIHPNLSSMLINQL